MMPILSPAERHAVESAQRFDDITFMRHNFPALFAQYPHPKMSQQYGFTDTYHLLKHLYNRGYRVRTVQQTGKGPYSKVLVRLVHPTLARTSDGAAELVVIDSHDGSAAFKVWMGFLRFACANGMILGDSIFSRAFKHTQPDLVEQVILDLDEATGSSNDALGVIQRMQRRILHPNERLALARDVVNSRFAFDAELEQNRIERAANALVNSRRRRDDLSDDLFTVMNVIQENALRGDITFTHDGTLTKVRPVSSIPKTIEVNKAAWNSAVKLLEAA